MIMSVTPERAGGTLVVMFIIIILARSTNQENGSWDWVILLTQVGHFLNNDQIIGPLPTDNEIGSACLWTLLFIELIQSRIILSFMHIRF